MTISDKINRREVLTRGLGAVGLVAGGLSTVCESLAGPEPADRSADAPSSPVAVQRCASFEPQLFRRKLDATFDMIGGITKLVRNKTVTVKLNMTGMDWQPFAGMPAYESYQTHPNTVAALCASLYDAGARRIIIIENLYKDEPPEKIYMDAGWDIKAIKSAGHHRVTFEDTRNRGNFPGYSRFKVPWGGFVYPAFDLNQRFEKTDVLISLAKLKQHACAGVTGAVKNFFGNTPCSLYGNDAPDENGLLHRTQMFHSGRKSVPAGVPAELEHDVPPNGNFRVPRIVADIFGARPADLNIVDGVRSISGGEGFWNRGVALVNPKLLLAGLNGVCTDAVCTAVMGFDPQAPHCQFPFPGDNHLTLLAEKGIGTNDVDQIEVTGLSIKEALYPYQPDRATG